MKQKSNSNFKKSKRRSRAIGGYGGAWQIKSITIKITLLFQAKSLLKLVYGTSHLLTDFKCCCVEPRNIVYYSRIGVSK